MARQRHYDSPNGNSYLLEEFDYDEISQIEKIIKQEGTEHLQGYEIFYPSNGMRTYELQDGRILVNFGGYATIYSDYEAHSVWMIVSRTVKRIRKRKAKGSVLDLQDGTTLSVQLIPKVMGQVFQDSGKLLYSNESTEIEIYQTLEGEFLLCDYHNDKYQIFLSEEDYNIWLGKQ